MSLLVSLSWIVFLYFLESNSLKGLNCKLLQAAGHNALVSLACCSQNYHLIFSPRLSPKFSSCRVTTTKDRICDPFLVNWLDAISNLHVTTMPSGKFPPEN